jgi:Ca2+-binding RTX toxin-like protein
VFQITGTQYADSLRGYSGNDTLIGGEGNDDIAGGDGNDLIKGGDGNDILKGEGGNDEIEGGEGNDTIDGGTGRQVIRAGIGDDTVVSAKAGDSIDGGEGNDTLQNLDLTSLDVNLVLDLRVTEQVSGDSNTHINNIENISSVNLGSGSDTIIATGNLLVSNGSINSGDGTDTLITDYSSASFIYLGNAGYGVTNIYADSFEGLWHRLAGWGVQTLLTYNNVEVFQITGTQYADSLRGYSGNDTLIGGEGNDDIAGGDGNDLIISVNPDVAKPGLGTVDTVTGGAGRDTFVLGDATWIGYDDCNSTTVGTSDYLIIKDFNPQDDIIQLWGSSSDYTITVSDNNINLYINKPDSEPDELIAVLENTQGLINPSQFRLNGSYFKYVITNVVTNQSPTDIVLTNPTTAIAENTSTTTRIKVADIAITDDALGTNNLSVSGTDASFFEIDGNVLYLKANTALNFEAKTSYSVNVNVDDSTVGSTTDATTNFTLTVTDINEAPVRNSAIASQAVNNGSAFNYFFGSNTFADPEGTALTYSISGQPSWLTFNSNTRTFGGIANGVGASTITVSASDGVNVTTTNFSLIVNQPVVTTTVLNQSAATSGQTIIGTTSVDSIFGSVFNDLIRAGNGEDTINGNGGNDRLYGEGGNDIIVGGFGTDNLYGGLGSDTFVIQAAGNGLDVVNDFQDGIDFIGLSATNSGGLTFASLTFTAFGTGGVSTSIRAGATEIMRLINVAPSLISNADFQSIG